jgi:hypothetical protein
VDARTAGDVNSPARGRVSAELLEGARGSRYTSCKLQRCFKR